MSQPISNDIEPVNEKPNRRFIKPAVFRAMLGNVSPMTEWRLRQKDPDFPAHHPKFGYLLDEAEEYVELKAAERPTRRTPEAA